MIFHQRYNCGGVLCYVYDIYFAQDCCHSSALFGHKVNHRSAANSVKNFSPDLSSSPLIPTSVQIPKIRKSDMISYTEEQAAASCFMAMKGHSQDRRHYLFFKAYFSWHCLLGTLSFCWQQMALFCISESSLSAGLHSCLYWPWLFFFKLFYFRNIIKLNSVIFKSKLKQRLENVFAYSLARSLS